MNKYKLKIKYMNLLLYYNQTDHKLTSGYTRASEITASIYNKQKLQYVNTTDKKETCKCPNKLLKY